MVASFLAAFIVCHSLQIQYPTNHYVLCYYKYHDSLSLSLPGILSPIIVCQCFVLIVVLFSLFYFSCSDSTLTLQNLLTLLKSVSNWSGLGEWLGVPLSRLRVMTGKGSMLEEWLKNHPTPSWKLVAWALYRRGSGELTEHNVLKQLYGKHVTGMWLCMEIISGVVSQYLTISLYIEQQCGVCTVV